ncbi:MAG: histidine phosphatase family protein [Ornithinimicrobium sp.]|uniref:histidine phosphatase family protein n=1 Tax=Ornithinimicrobium sp. TaxID=1977084 RepID=UPI003D9BAAB4
MTPATTIVHVVRHGEVHNPSRVLYGRLPDFHLSQLGVEMAERSADYLAGRDVVHVVSSPLERAQETAAPIAARHDLEVAIDPRLIEAENAFEGTVVAGRRGALRRPATWRLLTNPLRPSWGEPYNRIAERMEVAVQAAREQACGHEAVLVSHQLPVWTLRRHLEGKRLWHDPRRRQCTLASVTSVRYQGERAVEVLYAEPVGELAEQAQPGAGA